MKHLHHHRFQLGLGYTALLLAVVISGSAFLVACGKSASGAADLNPSDAQRTARELTIKPADVGQGAEAIEEPAELDTLTECGIRRYLLVDSAAYGQSPKMAVASSSFSSLVGLFPSEASAVDAYRALTKDNLSSCYVTLVRHRVELKASLAGPSRLVTRKLSSPGHGTEYEVITPAVSFIGENEVFSHIVLVQNGPSVYLSSSFVLETPDGFNPLETTATGARRRNQAVFAG